MLLQPWISREQYREKVLKNDLKALDISKKVKDHISTCIEQYLFFQGNMIWEKKKLHIFKNWSKRCLELLIVNLKTLLQEGNQMNLEKQSV